MPGGRSDDPLDIGKLVLALAKQVKIGEPAPLFEVKTLDDKPLKLADFRGKVVLLDFWATWCGPCVKEMPHFKAIHDEFGKDGRFVLIGLSLDKKAEAARQYVTDNDLKWPQGFLGEKSKTQDAYGVKGIPATFRARRTREENTPSFIGPLPRRHSAGRRIRSARFTIPPTP